MMDQTTRLSLKQPIDQFKGICLVMDLNMEKGKKNAFTIWNNWHLPENL